MTHVYKEQLRNSGETFLRRRCCWKVPLPPEEPWLNLSSSSCMSTFAFACLPTCPNACVRLCACHLGLHGCARVCAFVQMLVSARVSGCVYVGIVFTRARASLCMCLRARVCCSVICPCAYPRLSRCLCPCACVCCPHAHPYAYVCVRTSAVRLFDLRVSAFVQMRVSMYHLLTCPAVYPRCSWA